MRTANQLTFTTYEDSLKLNPNDPHLDERGCEYITVAVHGLSRPRIDKKQQVCYITALT